MRFELRQSPQRATSLSPVTPAPAASGLPREDVAERSTERIEPDNRKAQPQDYSPVLEITDDAFPGCVCKRGIAELVQL